MYKYEYNLIEIYEEHEMVAIKVIVQIIYITCIINRVHDWKQNTWIGIFFEHFFYYYEYFYLFTLH